jgi:predicted nucleic acid-binding protein
MPFVSSVSAMVKRIRVFLDTSALFAGIWSSSGGSRMLLKLGEAGAIHLLVSSQVLGEIENALREKAPESLGFLALLLERSRIEILPLPGEEDDNNTKDLVEHPGDQQVIVSAWSGLLDYFVTLDRKHFLENAKLIEKAPFLIGTPGDFLTWFRTKLLHKR